MRFEHFASILQDELKNRRKPPLLRQAARSRRLSYTRPAWRPKAREIDVAGFRNAIRSTLMRLRKLTLLKSAMNTRNT